MRDNSLLFSYDEALRDAFPTLCGIDEAGRGPLAGPVCCAAVVLSPAFYSPFLNDSKIVSEKRRALLYDEILKAALFYKVVLVPPQEIDRLNILNATLLGMRQAAEGLSACPDLILVDGNRCPEAMPAPCKSVIKGDAASASIAAASILAKVTRDRYMQKLGESYPEYRFEVHKGYPTKLHYEMIAQYGITPFHRKSFLKKQGY